MSADLGKRLTELRKYSNLTREELAIKISVKTKEVTKWESGESSPNGEQLIKLSQVYQMPIDEILLNFDTDSNYEEISGKKNEPNINMPPQNNGSITVKSFNWYAFPYPVLVVMAYLILGFLFDFWHPTWLLFLTIPIYYTVITMNRAKSFRAKANIFPYPVLCVIFYLSIGFDHGLWHPAWLLFLTIPIYYMLVNSIKS